MIENVEISGSQSIKLDQFLKWVGEADTGGIAKLMIKEGLVRVNGDLILTRGRILQEGDIVETENNKYKISYT